MGRGTDQHSRPHHGGGHAQTQHQPRPGKQHNRNRNPTDHNNPSQTRAHHAPPLRPTGINTAGSTMRGATHQHSTPDHEGCHKPTQHAPLWRGAHSNTARPTMGGGMHQHSVPHHEGGCAPAQTQAWPGDQHNHNRNLNADHSHPNTPTVRRRGQHQTNKTSLAWRRLKHHQKHHQPELNDASCQAAHTTTTEAKHHHTMHNHRGGLAATKHAPP